MEKILVVDNEAGMREFLLIFLKKEGYHVETAENGERALKALEREIFDLVITDIKMPGMSGLELLKIVNSTSPETMTVMMTAFASTETAIEAMKEGASDYLTKPFQIEEIKLRIQNVLERRKLHRENVRLRKTLHENTTQIIGKSEKIRAVLDLVEMVADNQSNVLIYGESGTGKELIARAIHAGSSRGNYPFVSINCSALPEGLLESELFGHMKGAFTGAIANKEGLFEVAHKGSLFLDEISETPKSSQVKLLRVLQEKEFRRIGGTKNIQVDVRIIAATNQDLGRLVSEGSFREDLYYRLDVIPITLPPLRERREDIPLLLDFFIQKFNRRLEKKIEGIDGEAIHFLMNQEWKGNVRELENVMERAIALAPQPILTIWDFRGGLARKGLAVPAPLLIPQGGVDLEALIGSIEKELLVKALQETHWVKKEAAKLLHIDFRSFRYRLEKYGVKRRKIVECPGPDHPV